MKVLLLFFVAVFMGIKTVSAQDLKSAKQITAVEISDAKIQESVTDCHWIINRDPEFMGGEKAFIDYLTKNLTKKINIKEVPVTVAFEIEERGKLINPKIEKGLSKALDKIILKRLYACPTWKPGIKNGKAMRKSYIISIKLNKV